LIDFGLARHFEAGKKMKTWAVTPFYAAPEILAKKGYTESVDVWSLGVITYIMLCGEPPFYGDNDEQIFKKVKNGKLDFSQGVWRSVTKDAPDFIMKCLTRDPSKRPSPQELLHFNWVVKGESAAENKLTETAASSLKKFQRRNKLQQSALLLIAKHLPQMQVDKLQGIFEDLDEEQKGFITMDQLKSALEDMEMGKTPKAHLRDSMIAKLEEKEKDLTINYSEFIAMTMEKKDYMQESYIWEVCLRQSAGSKFAVGALRGL
jgi:calcium-dependent protein kinase